MWLANKLKSQDSSTNLDVWHVTEIPGSAERIIPQASISDKQMQGTKASTILIPFGNYKPYREWKNSPTDGYTISTGDFIFYENPGAITPDNIIEKANDLEAIEVQSFFVVEKKYSTMYQIKVTGD